MAAIFSIEPSNVEDYKFASSVYLLAILVCDFNIVMLFQDIYCIYIYIIYYIYYIYIIYILYIYYIYLLYIYIYYIYIYIIYILSD